ncbi:BTAD domain-containing putative transcriptional regulator [Streptomyces sp. DG2A-72]|uniref:BTAD domain-containing putative transcriptional regulator n=1 Tax=Streptomyces sp. DG2A-72 TaxID=3051386 RepID=UPI00265B9AC7|nr:BTAD domain-containing putative transcriptional regulator [Streptomyces sp. DG2A-72]MDO0939015.1 BTAD domain-containing putative transcriptional regulator [Streptomyces sp. DG2A-72]
MRFGVLGPLAIWSADGELVGVPEAKVRSLLAALLTAQGQVVSADRLVDELWGDAPPANAAGALQTLVSRLRKVLTRAGGPGLLAYQAPGYVLEVADDAVDAGRFTALTARARTAADPRERAELLTEALGLWRGPAFAGFQDEQFAREALTRLEEQRLLALEEQAEARLELGEHSLLAPELGELTRRHPLRERLRGAHMRALYGAGRASEALDSYQDLRRRLDEDLGLEPGPELAALQQEILQQDPALRAVHAPSATPRPRTNLPTPVTDLIGRSDSVDAVRDLVESGRLVTLTGPGGVGKTRLAVEVATRLSESEAYADGVWLVELASQAFSAESGAAAGDDLAEVVAATLGVRDDTGPGPLPSGLPRTLLDRLTDALRGRRLLLVLDNCEHVIEAAAGLAQALLRGAPGVRVLATSQEPLDIAGEQLWPVRPLDLPEASTDPAVLRRSSAVRMFLDRAAATSPGFELTDDNARAVASICRRLDGIPLALELASTRVRVLGVRELAKRLDDRFKLLTGGHRGAPARQQTLRAMIDWSWELLTAAEQSVLRRLAIHSDGCTLDAAEAVCAGDGVKPAEVLDLLTRLVDRSLVLASHEADGPRYRLLESVSAYCLERLRATEYERVRRIHAHYYAAFAARADSLLRGGDQRQWLRRLDAESANIRGALDAAAAEGDAGLMRGLAHAMVWYWFLRGRLTEAKRQLTVALGLPGEAEPTAEGDPGRAVTAAWRAGVGLLSGAPDGSVRRSAAVLELYEDIRDPHERTRAGWFLGFAVTRFGDFAVGEELVNRVLAESRALGDRWGIAAGLSTRGMQTYVCGNLTASRSDGEESLALFHEAGDGWGRLQAMAVLGRLAEIEGDYREAARLHERGLRVAEDLGLWTDASMRWSDLGRIALLTGEYARADEFHERGRRLAVEQGDKPAEEFAELGLALGARRQGRLDAAESYLRTWLAWNRQFDAEYGAALILAELGFVAELRGDAVAALSLHLEGLAAARDTGDPRAVALAAEGLAGARALAGHAGQAARLLGAAAAARASVGAPLPAGERGDVDRVTAAVRAVLGEADFTAAFERGAASDPVKEAESLRT